MVLPERSVAPSIQARKIAMIAEMLRPIMPTQMVLFAERKSHHRTAAATTAHESPAEQR